MIELETDKKESETMYSYVFPLDRFGRLGGMYSLADLPVVKVSRRIRAGIVLSAGTEEGNNDITHYHIQDADEGFRVWVPAEDIDIDKKTPSWGET